MMENDADKLVTELQPKFVAWLQRAHRLGFEAFGRYGRFSGRDVDNDKLSELADATITEFSTLYDTLPDGHHLEIGLPPARYQELDNNIDTHPLCHPDTTEQGPIYWLSVGQRIDSPKGVSPGRSVLNLLPMGNPDPESPKARLDLAMITSKGQRALSPSIYPEEILALQIVPDMTPKIK